MRRGSATERTGPSLTVAAVARRLGVAPATLRTWDRRYGLGPSEHLAGSHRRYSSADLSRLLVMRRLTLEGVAPSEAARTALAAAPDTGEGGRGGTGHDGSGTAPSIADVMNAYSDAVPMAADPAALAAAAEHFDNAAVRWQLSRVHPRDTLAWYSSLVEPALRMLADRTVLAGPGEHAAPAMVAAAYAELRSRSAVLAGRLTEGSAGTGNGARASLSAVGPGGVSDATSPRTVLAVPAPGSELPMHVLCAALLEQGIRARVLASPVPGALAATVEEMSPDAVVVHAGGDLEPGPHAAQLTTALADVVAAREGLPVFVYLEGGRSVELPVSQSVHRVRSLAGALHEIVAVVT